MENEGNDPPFCEVRIDRGLRRDEARSTVCSPTSVLPPGCSEGAPELLPGLVIAVVVQMGDELGLLPAATLESMLRTEWVRMAAIANLQSLPPPRLDRIQAAEGRVDSDNLLLQSEDPFGASRVCHLAPLVKWASGDQPTRLGVLLSIPNMAPGDVARAERGRRRQGAGTNGPGRPS
jgi:hypothetical protein